MSKISRAHSVHPLLANVASATVTPQGTGGSETWDYQVVGVVGDFRNGAPVLGRETRKSAAVTGQTTGGNAALNETDFNRVTWTDVAGYDYYEIYRSASGGAPATTGFLGYVAAGVQQFDDTGLAPVPNKEAASAANTTGHTYFPLQEFNGDVAVSLEGVGIGTYQLQGSYGGAWINIGTALTADGVEAVTVKYSRLRFSCTAFTSGTPVGYVSGDTN